jgi:hypothetical protein
MEVTFSSENWLTFNGLGSVTSQKTKPDLHYLVFFLLISRPTFIKTISFLYGMYVFPQLAFIKTDESHSVSILLIFLVFPNSAFQNKVKDTMVIKHLLSKHSEFYLLIQILIR